MKNIIVFICSIVLFQYPSSAQEEIRFMDGSLADIMSIAKERGKNVFIDTYADWCVPCRRMKKRFKNKDVAQFFNEHFINYRVNMQNPTRANDLRRKYDVVFLPTMYIIDFNGNIKYQVDKELSVDELLTAGQRSLDPNSYVSESTSIRRNDGTVSGGNVSNAKKNTPKKHSPKSIPVEKVIVDANPKKDIPISTFSEATMRAKLLESYETVEESSDKILHVLGSGEMPPEILLQEAYFRFEFMDGSHTQLVKDYLATQSELNTPTNRKFVLDFITSTYSSEYKFLVDHKCEFIGQFGEDKINRTLEVLTYKTLHNAVPRPSLNESIELYSNLGEKDATRKAHYYYINRLISDGNSDQILKVGERYLSNKEDHEIMYIMARYLSSQEEPSKSDYDSAKSFLERAVKLNEHSVVYLDLLGNVYSMLGKKKKAKKTFEKAAQVAQSQGQNTLPTPRFRQKYRFHSFPIMNWS